MSATVPFCRDQRMRTPPLRLERRVDRVAHQIDQQLIELIAVGAHRRRRTLDDRDRQARLERGDAAHPRADVERHAIAAPAVAPAARTTT